MFDAILAARKAAGLTHAQVAERMGTKAPAVTRLENALITGTPSPSLDTVCWPGDLDIAPETLYDLSVPVDD